jgi:hypothetical protein
MAPERQGQGIARAFWSEKLGLMPSEVQPNGDFEYECAGIRFYVTKSVGKSPGDFTQASWAVDDIDATVTELRSRGVTFEEYDLPQLGMKTAKGITPFSSIDVRTAFDHLVRRLLGRRSRYWGERRLR